MSMITETASGILAEIRSANDKFETCFAAHDAAGMASCYTDDGMVLPTGSGPLAGTDAIRNFWQMVMTMGIATAKLTTLEVDQQNDTVIELGKYELGTAEGNTADHGKYIVIWKKDDGAWKLHKDIWNSSVTPN